MPNRREFLALASLSAGSTLVESAYGQRPLHSLLPAAGGAATGEDLTALVNVFIGTGGHGHTFPGATVPFGA